MLVIRETSKPEQCSLRSLVDIAQLVEQAPFKRRVEGSNPSVDADAYSTYSKTDWYIAVQRSSRWMFGVTSTTH
jgi:hypothetical protein